MFLFAKWKHSNKIHTIIRTVYGQNVFKSSTNGANCLDGHFGWSNKPILGCHLAVTEQEKTLNTLVNSFVITG